VIIFDGNPDPPGKGKFSGGKGLAHSKGHMQESIRYRLMDMVI